MKWLLMCAGLVVAVLVGLFVFKISPGNLVFYGLLLSCPLMHVFMMKGMNHGDKK